MPVSIVVGGQFGSEGKGKVAHYLARELKASFVVRCGGPNSGHTVVTDAGEIRIFQQLPTATVLPKPKLVICAGSYIDLGILEREISDNNIDQKRLLIDHDAVIITEDMKAREKDSGLINDIGSTGSGTGAAVAARINREKGLTFAKDIISLKPYLTDVSDVLRSALKKDERIIIEGTQGFGLSLLHSRFFPFVTSRDTTAAGFLAETGLSPLDVDDITLVIRAFPIRVSGNSGPLPKEIDWETVTKESKQNTLIKELTTVTQKTRRVARIDYDIIHKAILVNNPTRIVLNHLDYLGPLENGKIPKQTNAFVNHLSKVLDRKISILGFGKGGPNSIINIEVY